ncbi:MAG: hypothetical protein QOD80_506 [Verrucomicrobiota bacterium]|jgi:uncharacterized membrane protein
MKSKLTWLESALLVAPLIALLVLWNDLPARVPMHWNLRGEIDGWSSKAFILLMPLISLGIVALLHILPRFDPKLGRTAGGEGRMPGVLAILRLATAAFFGVIFWMQLAAALGHTVAAGRIVPGAVLLLLATIGNYSSNLRPNYFVGLRTPWTLESPETWRATHRLGGRLMFFGSALLLVLQFFVSASTFVFLFTASALLLVAWAFWYSWHHFHTQGAKPLESSGD